MSKTLDLYFLYAAQAGRAAISFLPETEDEFLNSELHQAAVCMRLQEMGEYLSKARRLFPEEYIESANTSWDRLIAVRNIISHSYVEVDMPIIWMITNNYLLTIIEQLEAILPARPTTE